MAVLLPDASRSRLLRPVSSPVQEEAELATLSRAFRDLVGDFVVPQLAGARHRAVEHFDTLEFAAVTERMRFVLGGERQGQSFAELGEYVFLGSLASEERQFEAKACSRRDCRWTRLP